MKNFPCVGANWADETNRNIQREDWRIMISLQKHFFPQVQHVWGKIKAPKMRASASGLGGRAALQVLALQKPKSSFNIFHLDLWEETTYFWVLKGNKTNIESLSFPWPFFFLCETCLPLKVVKQQSSETENENFLPHNLPTKKQVHGDSFAHHYAQELGTPALQGTWRCAAPNSWSCPSLAPLPLGIPACHCPTASGNPCLLQLPGLRRLSHNIKEQKLNQVICQVIKTELEQSLSNT